jgi:hypothetical protein
MIILALMTVIPLTTTTTAMMMMMMMMEISKVMKTATHQR